MNPDELRALADAVVYRDSLAIARVADYLRAQADAQPVAWVQSNHLDEPKRRSILQAVARGWCHPKNSGKEMDVDLADAIVDEVMAINQAEPNDE